MSAIQQMMLSFGGVQRPELTYIGTVADTAIKSSFTFSSVSFGTAVNADSAVVLVVTSRTAAAISSVTVGGSDTLLIQSGGSGNTRTHICYRYTTSSLGNIVVNFNANASGCVVSIYRLESVNLSGIQVRSSTNDTGLIAMSLSGLTGNEAILVGACAYNSTSATSEGFSINDQRTVGSARHVSGYSPDSTYSNSGFNVLIDFMPSPSDASAVAVAFY